MRAAIHLVHKPVGPTSFSVVRDFKTRMDARVKVCHGGTLDPFASGLLLILAGGATKLFEHLHAVPKVYEATVRWGVETDNGDPFGKVEFEGDVTGVTERRLEEVLTEFVGWKEQRPHTTSAKRVGGERAYVKAHRGEAFEMPLSRVYLHEATWLSHELPRESRLRIVVRGGYYVRALARDLGRVMGCGAHLSALRRVAIGPWEDSGEGATVEVRGRELLPWLASKELTDQEVGELRAKREIAKGTLLPGPWSAPEGFPVDAELVRGMHLERLRYLLKARDDKLRAMSVVE